MYNSNQELDIPAALAMLNHLTNDELSELLNDDGKFEDVVKDIKQFKDLENEKEVLMASNRSLAELNLSQQPELENGKKTLQDLSETGSTLCASIQEKIDAMKTKSGSMTVDSALELLQSGATEIEEESEKHAEKFLAGDMEVEEFLEQFLVIRKLMHLRKVKVDKMRELKRKSLVRNSGGPGYPMISNFPGMAPPTGVPYPMGPVSMPMPIVPTYRPY